MKTVVDETSARGWPRTATSTSCTASTWTTWPSCRMRAGAFASISLGVKKPDYDTVDQLAAEGLAPEYITIDIAHGHADTVKNMIPHLKEKLPQAFVIAGNVGTPEAIIDLENWGADATKVGIGPARSASPHEDRLRYRRLAAVRAQVVRARPRSRSLPTAASASTANRQEHPLRRHDGHDRLHARRPRGIAGADRRSRWQAYKEYYGSASDFNKGEYKHVEGKRILEPVKGKLADTLREMEEDIQSSISYAGGKKLMDIRKVNYVILGGDNAGEHLLM